MHAAGRWGGGGEWGRENGNGWAAGPVDLEWPFLRSYGADDGTAAHMVCVMAVIICLPRVLQEDMGGEV